jgi:hypothetical protein
MMRGAAVFTGRTPCYSASAAATRRNPVLLGFLEPTNPMFGGKSEKLRHVAHKQQELANV